MSMLGRAILLSILVLPIGMIAGCGGVSEKESSGNVPVKGEAITEDNSLGTENAANQ